MFTENAENVEHQGRVVPIVIGALGATSNNLEKHLQEISGKNTIAQLVKTAILGSAHQR